MELGEKIKVLRKSKNISQEQLAMMLNINRNYLSRVETDKSEPSASMLKNIAVIFNIDLNSFLDINKDNDETAKNIDYILNSCKLLSEKDLNFVVRIISVLKEEYVKIRSEFE